MNAVMDDQRGLQLMKRQYIVNQCHILVHIYVDLIRKYSNDKMTNPRRIYSAVKNV